MKPDDTIRTTYHRLGEETADSCSHVDGTICHGFDISGVHTRDASLICGGCATDDEVRDAYENDCHIKTTDEYMAYAFQCDKCENWIDTYLQVSRQQDTTLWHKLQWSQQLGELDSPITDDEQLAKTAERRAYNEGYEDAEEIDMLVDIGSETSEEYVESNPEACEPPTDSAMWANSILPDLRAISGYVDDMGHGTYQSTVDGSDLWVTEVFNHVVSAYRAGWYDKCVGNDKSDDYV